MQFRTRAVVLSTTMLAASLGFTALPSKADDDHDKHLSAGAIFGRGLNTAQPGNKVNHVIIVFKPGFKREDLDPFIPAAGAFVFPRDPAVPLSGVQAPLTDRIYYRGINPAGAGNAPTGDPVNASNRAEVVAFLEPGTYLVHCNVRGHLLDGMFAYVRVGDDD
jgi:hypothetical protein